MPFGQILDEESFSTQAFAIGDQAFAEAASCIKDAITENQCWTK